MFATSRTRSTVNLHQQPEVTKCSSCSASSSTNVSHLVATSCLIHHFGFPAKGICTSALVATRDCPCWARCCPLPFLEFNSHARQVRRFCSRCILVFVPCKLLSGLLRLPNMLRHPLVPPYWIWRSLHASQAASLPAVAVKKARWSCRARLSPSSGSPVVTTWSDTCAHQKRSPQSARLTQDSSHVKLWHALKFLRVMTVPATPAICPPCKAVLRDFRTGFCHLA